MGDMKQVPYSGPVNIRHRHIKCSGPGDLSHVNAPLVYITIILAVTVEEIIKITSQIKVWFSKRQTTWNTPFHSSDVLL
jgi:hypothetical protein